MKLWLLWLGLGMSAWSQGLPLEKPEQAGMSSQRLNRIQQAVEREISQGKLPGCVVLVGRRGKIVYRRAFGQRAVLPRPEPMTPDTVFDLASLTKPVACASSVMVLVEQGKIRLNDPLSRYLPELQDRAARQVTISQLLTHTSGYAAGLDRTAPWQGRAGALEQLAKEPLRRPAGAQFEYSDINYIALGLIVEKVSGLGLDQFSERYVFKPLKMSHTSYQARGTVAPTQMRGDAVLRGSVHDHVAAKMGGVGGHAGVFAPADDLARFCQMLLGGGQLQGVRILSPASVARMTRPVVVSDNGASRGLGWDIDTAYSSNRGELFPKGSWGHTGFTGTSLWIDPVSQTFVVFLSNRVHPDGNGDVTPLRARVATLAAAAIDDLDSQAWRRFEQNYASQINLGIAEFRTQTAEKPSAPATSSFRVLNGLDIVEEDGFRQFKGLRLGLITNHSGLNRAGVSNIELLLRQGLLSKLFSPEHGLQGKVDEPVADSKDVRSGLTVISLYGERKRLKPEDFEGIDALVFDIQDAGTRFYTYAATLRFALEDAARAGKPVFVLDRPNPLNGLEIEGPLPDGDRPESDNLAFTCAHSLPLRHGMTLGELARMFNAERKLGVDLRVVAMDPWQRRLWFDQTQQTWVNPSPNLRCPQAELLYPGVGLLETCNISVGRGTDRPFEQFGAPWIDSQRLAVLLNSQDLPGVRFVPAQFLPSSSKFANELCHGVQIQVVERSKLRPVRLGLEMISALWRLHPDRFELDKVDRLLVHRKTLEQLRDGKTPASIEQSWQADLDAFRARRQPFLLYP